MLILLERVDHFVMDILLLLLYFFIIIYFFTFSVLVVCLQYVLFSLWQVNNYFSFICIKYYESTTAFILYYTVNKL